MPLDLDFKIWVSNFRRSNSCAAIRLDYIVVIRKGHTPMVSISARTATNSSMLQALLFTEASKLATNFAQWSAQTSAQTG
jgi:hypothetical protein